MALALTNHLSMDAGGREFRFYTITHDATILVVSADLFDLDTIEWAGDLGTLYQSDIASSGAEVFLSITAEGKVLDLNSGAVLTAGDTTKVMLIGW